MRVTRPVLGMFFQSSIPSRVTANRIFSLLTSLVPSISLLAATEFTQGQRHYAKFQHPSDLGPPQPLEHWKVTLRYDLFEQNNDKLALQLTEPGRMGLLRLKVIAPGRWTLTSLDGELDVSFSLIPPFFPLAEALTQHFLQISPAVSTVDSKNMLTPWSWSLVKNIAEERNLGLSLETLNLPAKWGEVVKGTVRFFPLVSHFPSAQQMIALTACWESGTMYDCGKCFFSRRGWGSNPRPRWRMAARVLFDLDEF